MLILDRQAVEIAFFHPTDTDSDGEVLKLHYQDRFYDFIQAFCHSKLTEATDRYLKLTAERGKICLLIRESEHYSLWQLEAPPVLPSPVPSKSTELHQAGIWFCQELWLRLNDLLGKKQIESIGQDLLTTIPPLHSWENIDRLLAIDPLNFSDRSICKELEIETIIRVISSLTQKKLGHKFAEELITAIAADMPDSLRSALTPILYLRD